MSAMKDFAEKVSTEMGLDGEITDGVLAEAQKRLEGAKCRCHCCGVTLDGSTCDWDDGEPYCPGCRSAH